MGVTTTKTNKPFNPRAQDQSPLAYNRAALYSGKALSFDGVNDYVEVSNITDTYKSFVLSFNSDDEITSTTPVQRMFGVYSSYFGVSVGSATGVLTGETLTFLPDGSSRTATTMNFAANTWYHLAVVWNSLNNNFDIYINGQNKTILSLGTTSLSVVNSLKIGQTLAVGTPWKGKISGFKGFTESLTAAQIADLYNFPEKIVPTGVDNTALKLWLPMMEGAGTTAYDGSGNGNHGTIAGATYVNGVGAPVAQTSVIDWNKGTNLLSYSEKFNETGWNTTLTTITANNTTAPDGSNNADKLEVTTSGAVNELYQYDAQINVGFVISIFIKKDTARWFALGTNASPTQMVWFDLDNGVVGTESSSYTGVMTDKGNGWYRCGIIIGAGAVTNAYIDMCLTSSDNTTASASVGSSVFIWGAQVEQSTEIGAYIPNHASAEITTPVLLPAGLTTGRDITGVNLFENVRKQGALNLDGQSWAEVHDNASLDVTTGLTLEAWVYWDNSLDKGLMGKWESTNNQKAYLLYQTSNQFRMYIVSSDGTTADFQGSTGSPSIGWNHLVGTYDGANIKLYLNGAFDSSKANANGLNTTNINLEIGRHETQTSSQLNAPIAQPRIYNRALSAEEIQRNFNAGKNIYS